MTVFRNTQLARWPRFLLPLAFFILGLAFVPLLGLQEDELYFANGIFHLPPDIFSTHVFHHEIRWMLLPYLGALKSFLYYWIIYRIRPSAWTVRIPVLLIGAVTIWLFMGIVEKTTGRRVALVAGALLATDTMYLLTTTFDWGPVALQHLLSLAGIALLLKFRNTGRPGPLFWGFFWFGLAFWDKALFIWLFSGLVIAALAIFPRELWQRVTPRNLGVAAAGLLIGALPLVAYNIASGLNTFRSGSSFSLAQIPSRFIALRVTWDGEAMFDYMAHPPWAAGSIQEPDTELFDISDEVRFLAGFRYHYYNALEPAFVLALLLLPFLWRSPARKPMLFCLITMAVAWFQMAITENAGQGAHHVVLLWPFPHWFLALAFAQAAAWRRLQWKHAGTIALTAVVLFLALDNLLLTNEYLYDLQAYGPVKAWNDAIYRLSDEVGRVKDRSLMVDDWGIVNPLLVLHRNRLPLEFANERFLAPGSSESDRQWAMEKLADDVWIGHTPQFEETGVSDRIVRLARGAGFEKQLMEIVRDTHGNPVFEIFHFVPAGAVNASN